MVADVSDRSGDALADLTVTGPALFFQVRRVGGDGPTLWASDGSAGGTAPLVSMPAGVTLRYFTAAGNRLFFLRSAPGQPDELWTSDGTAGGTRRLAALPAGPTSSDTEHRDFTAVGGRLYFEVLETPAGQNARPSLWTSDGTEAGTTPLATFPATWTVNYDSLASFTAVGARLFFWRYNSANATRELWASDGTAAGTAPVGPAAVGDNGALFPGSMIASADGTLYFSLRQEDRLELWVLERAGAADPADLGPARRVAVLHTAVFLGDIGDPPQMLAAVGDAVYFAFRNQAGWEVWRSDGTGAGTFQVTDVYPGARSARDFSPIPNAYTGPYAVATGDALYFAADDGPHGRELWRLDADYEPPRAEIRSVPPAQPGAQPDAVTVTFNRPVGGLDVADLTLSQRGVTGNRLGGGESLGSTDGGLTWTLSGLAPLIAAEGQYTLTLHAYGSGVADATGEPLVGDASVTLRADVNPPGVSGAIVTGTAWSPAFRGALGSLTPDGGSGGIALAPGQPAVPLLPWTNVDRVSLRFSEAVSGLDAADLRIRGARVSLYPIKSFTYDPGTLTAAWTLLKPIAADRLRLEMPAAAVADLAGNPLAAWSVRLDVLPGDADRNGRVDTLDYALVRRWLGTDATRRSAGYSPFLDTDGNGAVDVLDLVATRLNFGGSLDQIAAPAVAVGQFALTRVTNLTTASAAALLDRLKSR